MIEVNLVPDVKQEFIRAGRVRNTIISVCILLTLFVAGLVLLMAMYVFGAQSYQESNADKKIEEKSTELLGIPDLAKALTVQNQLNKLSDVHNKAPVDSRIFDVLKTIIDEDGENKVSLNNFVIDHDATTITLDCVSEEYRQAEALVKTIQATTIAYKKEDSNDVTKIPLGKNVIVGSRSFSQDDTGANQLRFNLTFTFDEALFSRDSKSIVIQGPSRTNATDSALSIPTSIFNTNPVKENP